MQKPRQKLDRRVFLGACAAVAAAPVLPQVPLEDSENKVIRFVGGCMDGQFRTVPVGMDLFLACAEFKDRPQGQRAIYHDYFIQENQLAIWKAGWIEGDGDVQLFTVIRFGKDGFIPVMNRQVYTDYSKT